MTLVLLVTERSIERVEEILHSPSKEEASSFVATKEEIHLEDNHIVMTKMTMDSIA